RRLIAILHIIIITFQILTDYTLTNELMYNSIFCWPPVVCNNSFYSPWHTFYQSRYLTSWNLAPNSATFVIACGLLLILLSSSDHKCSIGFKSGDRLGPEHYHLETDT